MLNLLWGWGRQTGCPHGNGSTTLHSVLNCVRGAISTRAISIFPPVDPTPPGRSDAETGYAALDGGRANQTRKGGSCGRQTTANLGCSRETFGRSHAHEMDGDSLWLLLWLQDRGLSDRSSGQRRLKNTWNQGFQSRYFGFEGSCQGYTAAYQNHPWESLGEGDTKTIRVPIRCGPLDQRDSREEIDTAKQGQPVFQTSLHGGGVHIEIRHEVSKTTPGLNRFGSFGTYGTWSAQGLQSRSGRCWCNGIRHPRFSRLEICSLVRQICEQQICGANPSLHMRECTYTRLVSGVERVIELFPRSLWGTSFPTRGRVCTFRSSSKCKPSFTSTPKRSSIQEKESSAHSFTSSVTGAKFMLCSCAALPVPRSKLAICHLKTLKSYSWHLDPVCGP